MPQLSINLIVIRAADIDVSRNFYQSLGLVFVKEQHGTGPVHYSCELGSTVLEIYTGKPGTAPDRRSAGATTIGFQVEDMDKVIEATQAMGAVVLTALQTSEWGRRAVIQDPDGRAIELNQL